VVVMVILAVIAAAGTMWQREHAAQRMRSTGLRRCGLSIANVTAATRNSPLVAT